MGPHGSENFKTLLLQVLILFQPILFYMFSMTALTKVTYGNFIFF